VSVLLVVVLASLVFAFVPRCWHEAWVELQHDAAGAEHMRLPRLRAQQRDSAAAG